MSALFEHPTQHAAELAALARLLEFGEGTFSSSIAVCNSPVERDRLIAELYESHTGIVVLTIPARMVDIYGFVREHCEAPKTLFLIGLEASVSSQEADSHTLRSLNASRDLWPKHFQCSIVLWLPEYAATALAVQARDYWRYLSHRFYFAAESATSAPSSSDMRWSVCINAVSLSAEEKIARMSELECRLATLGQNPEPLLRQYARCWWFELAKLKDFCGESDCALQIFREMMLPLLDRCEDELWKASVIVQVAFILRRRGEYEPALKLFREQLTIFETHGDLSSKSLTLVHIANALYNQGKFDEALQLCRQEIIPCYELRPVE